MRAQLGFATWSLLSISTVFILSSCKSAVETFHKMNAESYTPTGLWDAMLGSEKQAGHVLSRSGPPPSGYVHIKGVVSRVELAPDDVTKSPALIFDVDRSSIWNGITLHGSVRAPFGSTTPETHQHFTAGDEVELTCQIGAAAMPFVYLLNCQPGR
jgi:hypothetical protein